MLDLAIRGGEVVDGTGAPRRRADVGVPAGGSSPSARSATSRRDDRGRRPGRGARASATCTPTSTPRCSGTPRSTPSSLHGVTTVMAGNCGFTLAPLVPDAADYLVRMLAVVEGMPLEALRAGVPLRLDDHRRVPRPHRRARWPSTRVPGRSQRHAPSGHGSARPRERPARPRRGGRHGAAAPRRPGGRRAWGSPRRGASPTATATASRCRRGRADGRRAARPGRGAPGGRGHLARVPPPGCDTFDEELRELLTRCPSAAGRPLNWNVLRVDQRLRRGRANLLDAGGFARDHGAAVVALTMPIPLGARFSFGTGFVLDILPDWARSMALPAGRAHRRRSGAPRSRRPARRRAWPAAQGPMREIADWGSRIISQTFDPGPAPGTRAGWSATSPGRRARSPWTACLTSRCADGLRTTFTRRSARTHPAGLGGRCIGLARDPGAVIGASDAGAHLDFTAYFDYPVYVLEHAVRRHGVLGPRGGGAPPDRGPGPALRVARPGTARRGRAGPTWLVFDEEHGRPAGPGNPVRPTLGGRPALRRALRRSTT